MLTAVRLTLHRPKLGLAELRELYRAGAATSLEILARRNGVLAILASPPRRDDRGKNGEKPKRMSGGRVEISLLKNDLEQLAGGATPTPQQ